MFTKLYCLWFGHSHVVFRSKIVMTPEGGLTIEREGSDPRLIAECRRCRKQIKRPF